jgi:HEAT repeat protein
MGWIAVSAVLIAAAPVGAWDEVIESVMYRSPELAKARTIKVYPKGLKNLWLEALRRPEADQQCQAALTIGLAHRYGIKDLESAVAPLLEVLESKDQHLSVRLAAAQALIELDAREAADRLFPLAESGDRSLRDLIEPALAHWDSGGSAGASPSPVRAVWLERLGSRRVRSDLSPFPSPIGGGVAEDGLLLAVRGLGVVREEKAIGPLRDLVFSHEVSSPIRLEAARALGAIRNSGLEKEARQLLADASLPRPSLSPRRPREPSGVDVPLGSRHLPWEEVDDRLAAASLLRHHQGDEAIRLLQELATDAEPAVALVALARLVEIDPKLVVPALAHLLASYDAKVRSFAIEVLFRQPTVEHIRLLANRLNDPHPELRIKARKSLHDLAVKAEFHEPVTQQGMKVAAGADWRGQEQAAILLTQLDHKPAAGRFVDLLDSDRPEVMVAVAWGLRRLAVAETLPAALKHFQVVNQREVRHEVVPGRRPVSKDVIDQQLCQLAQFFGLSRYRPADAALRQLVPRPANLQSGPASSPETRAASIWALGLIYEGQPIRTLVQALEGRVRDIGGFMIPPDDYRVRSMSAITLGRLKAKEALETLRNFYSGGKAAGWVSVHDACGWAIQQLTGEIMAPPDPVEVPAETFKNFLRPFEP